MPLCSSAPKVGERSELTFKNLEGVASLKAYRTSASENLQDVGDVAVDNNQAAFPMRPLRIVMFSGRTTK